MSLINWGPNDNIERRMNQLFEHFLGDVGAPFHHRSGQSSLRSSTLSPPVDVYETDKSWVVHAELPGVKKENIQIDLSEGKLTLKAETKQSEEWTSNNTRYQERRFGTFSRTVPLPDNVDRDNVRAKFNDGVLEIDLPKSSPSSARQITID
ncbi:HSP20-like chaperone [Radiomyces spectabilis]|uniref:HSP20-like chaperone n=1 Tax=Radiomyces spectabilis TaxID=64574 RepID=UPI00221F6F7A|nr:HSP20-like chaperone [Radiomyces spectabilis]KAI8384888.1 HSP20-like chaperone [Radiomyces spectabilis]